MNNDPRDSGALENQEGVDTVELIQTVVLVDYENIARGLATLGIPFYPGFLRELSVPQGYTLHDAIVISTNMKKKEKKRWHNAGFRVKPVPTYTKAGKNAADIRITLEAAKQLFGNGFTGLLVVVSSDSDFKPLIEEYEEAHNETKIIGLRSNSSGMLSNLAIFQDYAEQWFSRVSHEFYQLLANFERMEQVEVTKRVRLSAFVKRFPDVISKWEGVITELVKGKFLKRTTSHLIRNPDRWNCQAVIGFIKQALADLYKPPTD
jgi:uncharacterized LabA/DUF88 family protein